MVAAEVVAAEVVVVEVVAEAEVTLDGLSYLQNCLDFLRN
jgi:hypothetical protein